MSTEILKGKLLKNDHVIIEYQQRDSQDGEPANCTYDQKGTPRKELRDAFAKLIPLAALAALAAEFISIKDINKVDEELIEDFKVSGFTMVKGDEGVIITAQKTFKSGKTLQFNSPIIRFDDESETAYPFTDELLDALDLCKDELTQFLNGVRAEDPQTKLALQD